MRLETERQGRFLARRVLFKLGKAGTEACRADESRRAQTGALRVALFKLLRQGTRESLSGFACVLCDALGTRNPNPGELAQLYERMECEGRFRQWRNDSEGAANTSPAAPVPAVPAIQETPGACRYCGGQVLFRPKGKALTAIGTARRWKVRNASGGPHACRGMNDSAGGTADNVPEQTLAVAGAETPPRVPAPSPALQIATTEGATVAA